MTASPVQWIDARFWLCRTRGASLSEQIERVRKDCCPNRLLICGDDWRGWEVGLGNPRRLAANCGKIGGPRRIWADASDAFWIPMVLASRLGPFQRRIEVCRNFRLC